MKLEAFHPGRSCKQIFFFIPRLVLSRVDISFRLHAKILLESSSSEEEVSELLLSNKIFDDAVKVINGIFFFLFSFFLIVQVAVAVAVVVIEVVVLVAFSVYMLIFLNYGFSKIRSSAST